MADKFEFLSDEWFDAVRKIQEEHAGAAEGLGGTNLALNLSITDCPDGSEKEISMKMVDGELDWETSHIDGADAKVITDYATAKAIFVSGDQQAGMQAFMSGQLRVEGDMTKLMALQSGSGAGADAQKAIQEITAD
ncbi:MAG: SCP-2 sterol transfer family protein [Acidobacteria bacterium]|nr:MAG: SCP-2 sterol transfer family protein [Acidobacteriota bacterium]